MFLRVKRALRLAVTNPREFLRRLGPQRQIASNYRKFGEAVLRWQFFTPFAFRAAFGPKSKSVQDRLRKRSSAALTVYSLYAISTVRKVLVGPHRKSGLHSLLEREKFVDFSGEISERMRIWHDSAPYNDLIFTERTRRDARIAEQLKALPLTEPLNLLIVSENWNFTESLVKELSEFGFKIRTFHFPQYQKGKSTGFSTRNLFVPVEYYSTPEDIRKITKNNSPIFHDLMDWADIVLAEWCNIPAIWLSRALDEKKKLVVRLHSYEAFTFHPYFMNWGGVDGIIYVSDPIRQIMNAKHGERLAAVRQITLPNVRKYPTNPATKVPEDRSFVLGLAGYNSANKNPIMALEILKKLRSHDPRWHLKLVGYPWPEKPNLFEANYRDRFFDQLKDESISSAVSVQPFVDEMYDWCRSIGFMLSTSDREGTHETIVEGMSVGAVPIIRNWPMVAPFGGPKAVYPYLSHLMFDHIEDAVEIILNQNASFTEAANGAMSLYEDHLSPKAVAPRYASFLRHISSRARPVIDESIVK